MNRCTYQLERARCAYQHLWAKHTSILYRLETDRCFSSWRLLLCWVGRRAESENAKSFQIADFETQKLSGRYNAPPPPRWILCDHNSLPPTFRIRMTIRYTPPWIMMTICYTPFPRGLWWQLHTVRKLYRVSGNFPRCPETFKRVRKHSIVFVNFPGCPESFPECL